MNGTNVTHTTELQTERTERSLRVFAGGGSLVEAIGGIAAVVLAVIGLASTGLRNDMMAIATIVLGASLILEGGAIAASYRKALYNLEGANAGSADLGGAATVEFLAGMTGVVLGILALLGIGNLSYFISVSAIVFGASLLLSSSAVSRLNAFWHSSENLSEGSRSLTQSSSEAGTGGQMLIGLAAVVLGILALLSINTMVLNLVALLALGVSVWLTGTSFGAHTMMHSKRV